MDSRRAVAERPHVVLRVLAKRLYAENRHVVAERAAGVRTSVAGEVAAGAALLRRTNFVIGKTIRDRRHRGRSSVATLN